MKYFSWFIGKDGGKTGLGITVVADTALEAAKQYYWHTDVAITRKTIKAVQIYKLDDDENIIKESLETFRVSVL